MTHDYTRFRSKLIIDAIKNGDNLSGKDGAITPLIKQLTEAALKAELDEHLAQEVPPNRKNCSTKKTLKGPTGHFELEARRDRSGTFEPKLVKKHQTNLTEDIERKIIALFALGNNHQDIREHIMDMYDISLPNGTINAVTDKPLPELQAWREHDLIPIYPILWLDATH